MNAVSIANIQILHLMHLFIFSSSPQRDLVHEAQKAFHYGFDEHKALQALTSVPAKSLKLDHRVGRCV
jgi:imidazolonepropionase-like amidohydrolase